MGLLVALFSLNLVNNLIISKAGPRLALARRMELVYGARARELTAGRDGVALWELSDRYVSAEWLSATDIVLAPLAWSATLEGLLKAAAALKPLEGVPATAGWTLESRCLSPHGDRPMWSGALPCALAQALQPRFGQPALGSTGGATTALVLVESADGFWLGSQINIPRSSSQKELFLSKWAERPFHIGSAATNPEVALIIASLALGLAKSSCPTIVDACTGSGTLMAALAARICSGRKIGDEIKLMGLERSAATAAGASENMAATSSFYGDISASVVCTDAQETWPLPPGQDRDLVVIGNLPWGHSVKDDGASNGIVRQAALAGAHTAIFITSDAFELPENSPWERVETISMTAGRSRGVRSSGPLGCSLVVLRNKMAAVA
jgi:predicted RNA methylase